MKRAFLYHFDLWADSAATHRVGFEYIPVHVHIPVLPLKLPPKPAKNEMLTNAVIQGSFDPNRRDFEGVFKDLIDELTGQSALPRGTVVFLARMDPTLTFTFTRSIFASLPVYSRSCPLGLLRSFLRRRRLRPDHFQLAHPTLCAPPRRERRDGRPPSTGTRRQSTRRPIVPRLFRAHELDGRGATGVQREQEGRMYVHPSSLFLHHLTLALRVLQQGPVLRVKPEADLFLTTHPS